ncbi:hypothetical protein [Micromonospora sp. NPDC049799]|uniref:hypothetical protein n=1 Tax=Micromonospora sp. NPDC049799 TaxID=3154741 RepID=UPI0033E04E6B
MKRTLLVTVVVLVVGIGAGVVWGRHVVETRDHGGGGGTGPVSERRVATGDGRLSVDLPTGWEESACPTEEGRICLLISPAGAGEDDGIAVFVTPLESGRGSMYDFYTDAVGEDSPSHRGLQRVTVDGMSALRIDHAQMPRAEQNGPAAPYIMVVGEVVPGTAEFTVMCRYDQRRTEIRSACDAVTASLRLRR